MTVEFLDSVDPSEPDADAVPGDRRARLLGLADVTLSVGGAALLVVSTFWWVYSVDSVAAGYGYHATAWGRIVAPRSGFEGHGPRIGILLCVIAAAVLIALAVRVRGTVRAARIGTVLGIAAVSAGAAACSSLVLDVLGAKEAVDAMAGNAVGDDGASIRLDLNFTVGGVVWLSVAGVAGAAAALVIPAVARWSASRGRGTADAPDPVTEGDEQLG